MNYGSNNKIWNILPLAVLSAHLGLASPAIANPIQGVAVAPSQNTVALAVRQLLQDTVGAAGIGTASLLHLGHSSASKIVGARSTIREVALSAWSAAQPAKPSRNATVAGRRAGNRMPFGATPVRFGPIPSARRLTAAIEAGQFSHLSTRDCSNAHCRRRTDTIGEATGVATDFMSLVRRVNTSVNAQIRYAADTDTVGQLDHWSLPGETLRRGTGDCEDYAILKMAALQKAGVPAKSMSVLVLKDTSRQLYHAVLMVHTNSGFLVLDNVRDAVLFDHEIPEYRPLFSVSAKGNRVYGFRQNAQIALSTSALDQIAPGAGY